MPSDQVVSARHVLQSLMRAKRQGAQRAMSELERTEPDLAGYLMEELSLIHQKLFELGAPAARTRWVVRRIESLTLVCIAALRQGHYDLWERDMSVASETNAYCTGSRSLNDDVAALQPEGLTVTSKPAPPSSSVQPPQAAAEDHQKPP